MRREWAEDDGERDGGADELAGRVQRRGVRLPFITWERAGVFVAILALSALFADSDEIQTRVGGERMLDGHLGLIESLRFSADGKTLLSSGWDQTVRVWGVESRPSDEFGRELACLKVSSEVYAAEMSPDGRTVAVAGLDGLTLWDWQDASTPIRTLEGLGPSRSLTFSPDGRTLALGEFDHRIRLLDVETGRPGLVLEGHRDVVRKVAFTPDARRLLSLSYDGRLKAWDLSTGDESDFYRALADAGEPILTFALDPVAGRLAVSRYHSDARRIEIWDVSRGTLDRHCEAGDTVHALAFSQDGSVLASTGADLRVRFWNPADGRAAGALDGEQGWVRALDFSADGRWMALTSLPDQVLLKPIVVPRLAAGPSAPRGHSDASRTPGDA